MTYSTAELETIGLCIALEAIGDIANHALLELREVSSFPGEVEVYFHTDVHQQLFLIRLLDFVKEKGDPTLTGVSGSCLEVLQAACESKSFDSDGSVAFLKKPTCALNDWLTSKTALSLWLPSLNIEEKLNVSRLELLSISGNQAKHNLSRLTRMPERIASMLGVPGYDVPLQQIPLALDDFRVHLEEDFFVYYGTWLAELLNNVRWGLQEYLLPTFRSSFTQPSDHKIAYTYRYPASIVNDVPREWFWRLMNNIRAEPRMKPFSGAHYLKKDVLR